jgi:hypothetical protein
MRASLLSAVFALAVTAVAAPDASAQGLGYGIVGPAGYSGWFGSSTSMLGHVAGGGELLIGGVAGGSGEFGLLGGSGGVLVVTSANAVVHVVPSRRDQPLSPFITGGFTHMSSGEGAFDGWNVGAGADVWTRDRVGLRLEFRDHVRPDSRGAVQYWSIRAGIAFR